MRGRLATVAIAVLVAAGGLTVSTAGLPAGAATVDVTLTVDPTTLAAPIDPRVGGVVMVLRDERQPLELVSDLGLTGGRVDTWDPGLPPNLMPKCWSNTPSDFALLDPYLDWALAVGLDPRQAEFRLLYTSSCHVTDPVEPVADGMLQGPAPGANMPWLASVYTNPAAVEQMLFELIGHAADRGFERFVVWAEPDGGHATTPNLYNEYYRLANLALRRVEAAAARDLEIGGPAVAGTPISDLYMSSFFTYVINNGLDLDAVVVHKYAGDGAGTTSAFVRQYLERVQGAIADLRTRAPHLDPELVVDEWNHDVSGNDPSNIDGSAGAFVASNLTTFADVGVAAADYFVLQDNPDPPAECRERQPTCQPLDAWVNYGSIDSDGVPRSSYHVLQWWNRLGSVRVPAEPDYAVVQGRQEWGGIATLADNGAVRVLLRNWDPERSGDDLRVVLDTGSWTVAGWQTGTVGLGTGGVPVHDGGLGSPTVVLPANSAVLLTLRPASLVETEPPETAITARPPARAEVTTASFSFTGADDTTVASGLGFECRVDAGPYGPCTSPTTVSGLSAGTHTFRVRARDAAGNRDPTVALAQWFVTAGDTGWIGASSHAPDTGGDGNGFEVDAAGAFADAGTAAANIDGPGDRHRFGSFPLGVPAGATVDGIEIRTDWWSDSAFHGPRLTAELSIDGGATWTAPRRTISGPNAETSATFGGPADTWGLAVDAGDIAPDRLLVRLTATCALGSLCSGKDWFVDWVAARVRWQPGAVLHNQAPTADVDRADVAKNDSATIAVLANDSDPDGDTLDVVDITQPASGLAAIVSDGTVRYTPRKGWTGTEAFTYTVTDGRGATASSAVVVTVAKPDH